MSITYGELAARATDVRRTLAAVGIGRGEHVAMVLPSGLDAIAAVLGVTAHGAVVCPLPSGLGPIALRERLAVTRSAAVITSSSVARKGVLPVAEDLPRLRSVLTVDTDGASPPATRSAGGPPTLARALFPLIETTPIRWGPLLPLDVLDVEETRPDDPAIVHVTSGTTGLPKAVVHVHDVITSQLATASYAFDMSGDDIVWCTAEPGWVTGTAYGILAPLAAGATTVIAEGGFDPMRWWHVLDDERVTVWYTAPTALRMLARAWGRSTPANRPAVALRCIASVGEPLPPDLAGWVLGALDVPLRDTWWQTETGAIVLVDRPDAGDPPMVLGRPVPEARVTILASDPDGCPAVNRFGSPVEADDGVIGALAVHRSLPSLFRGYLGDRERTTACFAGDWYVTGDLARRHRDGTFEFIARADDAIKTAGHLVGPAEVEAVLRTHEAVDDAAAFGVPDPIAGQVVHAVVVLRNGIPWSEEVELDILAHGREMLGAGMAPRQVRAVTSLPVTPSGKVRRADLRAVSMVAMPGSAA